MNAAPGDPASTALALGRSFLGLATLGSGVLQLATGAFVRIVPKLPDWLPGQGLWASLFGGVLVLLGLALLTGVRARQAALGLGVLLLAVALLHLPQAFGNPLRGFLWTAALKALALLGGALVFAGWSSELGSRLAPVLLALFLVVCGLQHFVYLDFVTAMVPSWIPNQRFWACFTGVALMLGGTGLLVPRTARLAAGLSALMIYSWVLLLHIPRALAGPQHAFEAAGVFEALALSGVALVVAGTRAAYPSSSRRSTSSASTTAR